LSKAFILANMVSSSLSSSNLEKHYQHTAAYYYLLKVLQVRSVLDVVPVIYAYKYKCRANGKKRQKLCMYVRTVKIAHRWKWGYI
jgi:hypothetical protein